ncbi:MAG: peptidylprolyl isomerase [Pyrinomonadaceae bacterium]
MKVCPKCNKEFEDNLNYCTEDYTELETIESSDETSADLSEESVPATEAPTEVLKADDLPATEDLSEAVEEHRDEIGEAAKARVATAASEAKGLSASAKGLILVLIIFAIGGGLVFWRTTIAQKHNASLNRITAEEMEILLKDANPMMLKRLGEDQELRKQQAENLQQLLAVASQARKEGIDREPYIQTELRNMRNEILAVNYDQTINKDKGPMPPFGFIGEDRVKEYWASHNDAEEKFQEFLDAKIKLLQESNPAMKDRQPTQEEIDQAKDFFAKIQIYSEEAEEKIKSGELDKDFETKIDLQVKLQQAQLLARLYSQKVLAEKTKVTDEEVDKYIAEHAELDPQKKKAKAEEILQKAKAGEDFAKLANEFSEDPGNKDPKGELQGGLYKDVPKGRMMPEFEQAALALEPGQIAPNLVETPYGYHIIKLEKKEDVKDQQGQMSQNYDVRHILISTTVKDPENPMGRELPVKEMVRNKLETEKSKKVLDEILASNPVEVAVDYKVPEVSDEELQKMMQKQMPQQMPQGGETEEAPAPPKPEPKSAPKPQPKAEPKKDGKK